MQQKKKWCTRSMILLLVAGYGCADSALDVTRPSPTVQSSKQVPAAANAERAALTTITRAVAMALADDALRSDVLDQMRKAPFKEHKLELRKYLNPGKLARLGSASGKKADDIASALKAVRDLEFYMPIATQRESWTGDANLLVASQLDDGEPIVAFNLKGKEVAVSEASPPTVPTLTIVPVETRFDEPVDPAKWKNVNDKVGKAIGSMVSCAENTAACFGGGLKIGKVIEDGGGGGGGGYVTPGLYMTFSRIVDMGEPWTKGDPEIEVHVHGPVSGGNSQYGEDLACSGEHALLERRFDQNNAFWNGSALIWSQEQINGFNGEFPDGHNVLFWEDDDTRCLLKFDKDVLRSALLSIAGALGGAALKTQNFGGIGLTLFLASFLATIYEDAGWLLSNDEFLGALVPASRRGDSWSDANLTLLKDGNVVNGRANMIGK